jgi:hypothetical protein
MRNSIKDLRIRNPRAKSSYILNRGDIADMKRNQELAVDDYDAITSIID